MGKIESFRDLVAWQRGMELVCLLYTSTAKMPESERFGLTNQMRRAAVSIPSNIAEGYGRESLPGYLKFLRIARGSIAELETQIELSRQLNMMPHNPALNALVNEESRILQGLISSLRNKQ